MAEHSKLPDDKLTFRQKEVLRITNLDAKVIDYWEKEFGKLKPMINKMGEKFYSRGDVELILEIKEQLIDKRRSKDEVRHRLEGRPGPDDRGSKAGQEIANRDAGLAGHLSLIRQNLVDILTILDKNGKK